LLKCSGGVLTSGGCVADLKLYGDLWITHNFILPHAEVYGALRCACSILHNPARIVTVSPLHDQPEGV
jgi:hypothetical protein